MVDDSKSEYEKTGPTLVDVTSPLPLLPLRDVVVFPHMVIPLFVGRAKSIKAMEISMEGGQHILLATQRNASQNEPSYNDLYRVGCVANILQMLKLPDGTVKVLVEGIQRASILDLSNNNDYFSVHCELIKDDTVVGPEHEALRRTILGQFEQFVKLNKKISADLFSSVSSLEEFSRLSDTIVAHLPLKIEDKQEILETSSVVKRMEKILEHIETELDILQVEKRIRGRVKRQMEKSQRDYYLNEQVKAIQKELGEGEDSELDDLEKKIASAGMSSEALEKAKIKGF